MFTYKLVVLGYIFVVEIGNTQIEKDVEYKSKIEYTLEKIVNNLKKVVDNSKIW